MNPKKFLCGVGVILLVIGILGFVMPNLAGDFLHFDPLENWAHVILGVIALALSPMALGSLKKWIVVLIGGVALIVGVLGVMGSGNPAPNFYGLVNFEMVDNVLHVVIGLWALVAAFKK